MRKLVTHRVISEIKEHPNADKLELAIVDGWQCVVKKGEFQKGDSCCYFEIDSFLPMDDDRFVFLSSRGTKTDEAGQERFRLRTVKLRKELSQGLVLPWSDFPEFHERDLSNVDMAEELNVIKFERPETKVTNAAGYFPDCIKKTDEERVQNIYEKYKKEYYKDYFVPTLKLDGSSCTVAFLSESQSSYWKNDDIDDSNAIDVIEQGQKIGEIIVCSRNLQLKVDDNSHFWNAAYNSGAINALIDYAKYYHYIIKATNYSIASIAIQGEVIGPDIQDNKEKLNRHKFYVFNIFDISQQEYLAWDNVEMFSTLYSLKCVPVVGNKTAKPFQDFKDLKDLLEFSDGPSLNAKRREGIVWKHATKGDVSFKAISNQWLIKEEE